MKDRWDDREAVRFADRYAPDWGEDLALRVYSSRLLGSEPDLVLHGGGNTSVKGNARDVLGTERPALFVKASGRDLATAEPQDHPAAGLQVLTRLARLARHGDGAEPLDDAHFRRALRASLFDPDAPTPSIEAPVHAVLPGRFVDHTHADAVLALTNRPDGEEVVREVLGGEVVVLPYVTPGHALARAVAAAVDELPPQAHDRGAMVWLRHGLVTWGETAEESYRRMIELAGRAEAYLAGARRHGAAVSVGDVASTADAEHRWAAAAPLLRGLLALPSGDPDRPWRRVVLRCDRGEETRALLARADLPALAAGGPLTADHLIRTKAEPLLLDELPWDDADDLRQRLGDGVGGYETAYAAYVERHRSRPTTGVEPSGSEASTAATFAPGPRVLLLPGCGVAAAGGSAEEAQVALDVALHTLRVKAAVADCGARYEGLTEEHLFDMEYRPLQLAKLAKLAGPAAAAAALPPTVALVTGAAGAIGAGICRQLLAAGAHLAVTDLAGPALDSLAEELAGDHPGRVLAVALDVTDADGPRGVAAGFDRVAREWGGVDLVVVNAGAAHVATIESMELADFERLERINVHGTLLLLRQAARHLRRQGTGGDVVVVSTKNVFAPGASFSAYSATKAAAHQIARIASQELAGLDVRVNMVAPDAVFGAGERKSGLWQEVGPERMKARGLSEEGLEEYYRGRNLLKARITAEHVGRAVVFFASRRTPTTGATLPVDGGLPDATPR
jgi:rhamnose utilization protein RhaD (predicted bifunctional aldolase and dehydrogenase)/NAD(P)-dependent dehydrogenase (short-subunit alcohol dehydrogenase family)